jgi:hypothetical protein
MNDEYVRNNLEFLDAIMWAVMLKSYGWVSYRQRILCRVSTDGHSVKIILIFENFFVECPLTSTRQSKSSPGVSLDTRQNYNCFFCYQTFCGVFQQYIDLHVQFCHNYQVFDITIRFSSFN